MSIIVSAKLLMIVTKTSKISESLLLQIDDDAPLSVLYKLDDMGHFQFFIAPYIEEIK